MSSYVLQFHPSEITERSAKYKWHHREAAALEAGAKIRAGDLDSTNLLPIFSWKVRERRKALREVNTQEVVTDALILAMSAKTVRCALTVLTSLSGVAIPVASAILTAIYPETYTIIDFRALAALNCNVAPHRYSTVVAYEPYLRHCQEASAAHGVSLRTYDRALWQWSDETGTTPAWDRGGEGSRMNISGGRP